MTVLVVASHDNAKLARATLRVLGAAARIGGGTHVLVAGKSCGPVAQAAAKAQGVEKVLLADDAAYEQGLAENLSLLVSSLAGNYSHILTAADSTGKDFMPRVAAMLDVTQISEISAVLAADRFKRPVYAGNAIETVHSQEVIKVLTVRQTAFDAVAAEGGNATVETIASKGDSGLSSFVSRETVQSERPDLGSARIVVSGGRGFGSKENFALVDQLATKLGAATGASRAAVDAGYISNDAQVGQTGKIVAPDLYIALGISGAIQHLAGMKSSKVIVAINKDENAPIFEIADYGLVADVFEAVPALITLL
ncbi:MAG TPA: FAD-binding protein [Rickettsiales bacterium]|nr:FAD-binding protein [Rickettsiales bacterium]